MPWPGDEGEERWGQAWKAIKKVSSIHILYLMPVSFKYIWGAPKRKKFHKS